MTHPQCICVIPHFPQRRMQLSRHDVWTLLEQGESEGGWGEGEKGKGGGGQGRLQRSRLETAMPPPCLASPCPEPAKIDREKVRGRKPGSSHEHIPPLVVHGISRCLRLASPLPPLPCKQGRGPQRPVGSRAASRRAQTADDTGPARKRWQDFVVRSSGKRDVSFVELTPH